MALTIGLGVLFVPLVILQMAIVFSWIAVASIPFVIIVLLLMRYVKRSSLFRYAGTSGSDGAVRILRERYARGEINDDEYTRMLGRLEQS